MHPIHCAKVDVRTHCRKGSKGRELAIHHFSQGRRRTHTAPPSFSRGTELQDHTTLSVPRPSDAVTHSALRSPSKSRADYGRTQTPNSHTNLLSTSCCAPHLHRGATESPSLWQRTAASVTSFAMARLPRACHIPYWATAVLSARSSRVARHDGARLHLARRLLTRCIRGLTGKVSAQRGLPCNFYSVNGKACKADLFAEHPVPLKLEEKMAGVGSAVAH